MHLVYVDDSGDSRNGTILTALLVPETPTDLTYGLVSTLGR